MKGVVTKEISVFISRYSSLLAIEHANAAEVHLHVKDSSQYFNRTLYSLLLHNSQVSSLHSPKALRSLPHQASQGTDNHRDHVNLGEGPNPRNLPLQIIIFRALFSHFLIDVVLTRNADVYNVGDALLVINKEQIGPVCW